MRRHRTGSTATSVVGPPAGESIRIVPSTPSTRARMPASPVPAAGVGTAPTVIVHRDADHPRIHGLVRHPHGGRPGVRVLQHVRDRFADDVVRRRRDVLGEVLDSRSTSTAMGIGDPDTIADKAASSPRSSSTAGCRPRPITRISPIAARKVCFAVVEQFASGVGIVGELRLRVARCRCRGPRAVAARHRAGCARCDAARSRRPRGSRRAGSPVPPPDPPARPSGPGPGTRRRTTRRAAPPRR